MNEERYNEIDEKLKETSPIPKDADGKEIWSDDPLADAGITESEYEQFHIERRRRAAEKLERLKK